jgi:hypothetical protein
MRVRRSIVVLIAALAIWTFASFSLVDLTSGTHGCNLLSPIPSGGGTPPKLTQAEMDAKTAACSQPRLGDFFVPAVGYILIIGSAVASSTAGKREVIGDG